MPQCAGYEAGRQGVSGDGSPPSLGPATSNATFKHQIALHGPKGYYGVVSVAVLGDLNRRDQSARLLGLVQSASLAQCRRRSANVCCTLASVASMCIIFSVAYISLGRQSNRLAIACTKNDLAHYSQFGARNHFTVGGALRFASTVWHVSDHSACC